MQSVTVKMKDGTVRKFEKQQRPGGSYTLSVRYEGAFVIVEDVWGAQTAIPAGEVAEVQTQPEPGRW